MSADSRRRGVHWFRSDLRLRDNTPLAALADRVDEWLPVFVIDPALTSQRSPLPRARFLFDCLERLRTDLEARGIPLRVLEGDPLRLIPSFVRDVHADVLSFGEADTPFARKRDERVRQAIESAGGEVLTLRDHTVFAPEEIRTKAGGPYSVFTPYRNTWWSEWAKSPRLPARRIRLPASPISSVGRRKPKSVDSWRALDSSVEPRLPGGGEAAAQRRLKRFLDGPVENYASDRDRPDRDGTSRLSPYLRFGVLSARQCFDAGLRAVERDPRRGEGVRKWLDELVWREFYASVMSDSPRVLTENFRPEYDALEWSRDEAMFRAWCDGRTGYPFIDAGMRQLNSTAWMHNRVRMVVASFLTKDLLIDWRWGAKYFFDALVDGDPASNNGGWQWAASTGTDAQPYFRIFNPIAQGVRWDPDGDYVRRFVPELRDVPTRFIHEPWKLDQPPEGYPAPIVDHAERREIALAAYRKARAQR